MLNIICYKEKTLKIIKLKTKYTEGVGEVIMVKEQVAKEAAIKLLLEEILLILRNN